MNPPKTFTLHHGDCLTTLATLQADSIDCAVEDPPAGIGFMGKPWDSFKSFAPTTDRGREVQPPASTESPAAPIVITSPTPDKLRPYIGRQARVYYDRVNLECEGVLESVEDPEDGWPLLTCGGVQWLYNPASTQGTDPALDWQARTTVEIVDDSAPEPESFDTLKVVIERADDGQCSCVVTDSRGELAYVGPTRATYDDAVADYYAWRDAEEQNVALVRECERSREAQASAAFTRDAALRDGREANECLAASERRIAELLAAGVWGYKPLVGVDTHEPAAVDQRVESATRSNFGVDPYSIEPDAYGHRTRGSDASTFDTICVCCGATDRSGCTMLDRRCERELPERESVLADVDRLSSCVTDPRTGSLVPKSSERGREATGQESEPLVILPDDSEPLLVFGGELVFGRLGAEEEAPASQTWVLRAEAAAARKEVERPLAVLIDSAETAAPFLGRRVIVHCPTRPDVNGRTYRYELRLSDASVLRPDRSTAEPFALREPHSVEFTRETVAADP